MLRYKTMSRFIVLAVTLALAGFVASIGTTALAHHSIKIGNTNPYSGPASAYGTIGKGIAAYFKKINDEGGIDGHKIEFISYDDGYSPPKTVEQIRRLVEQDRVDLLFQTLGTPTNSAIHKYVNAKKVPHMFVATGASKWANPKKYPWTMGWQPNYPTEAKIYAKYVMNNISDAKIGILFQNDDYGKDYLDGFRDGLGSKGRSQIVKQVSYEVTDPTIDSQIVSLKAAGANVFFNISTPKFAAQAIRKVHGMGWKPVHLLNNVSASVGSVLKPAGLERSKGIISAAYFKDPTDPKWKNDPALKRWQKWMAEYYPEGNVLDSFNVYAYMVTQTMVQVLRQANGDFSRKNLMREAANIKNLKLDMLLPGIAVNTGPNDFRPLESLQLEKFDGTRWILMGDIIHADR